MPHIATGEGVLERSLIIKISTQSLLYQGARGRPNTDISTKHRISTANAIAAELKNQHDEIK